MPAKTCFVMMPFGKKPGANGEIIDFDEIYADLIAPVAQQLNLDFKRADEVQQAGSIHRDMIERIARSDVVIVDITAGNPNVFYELGVRHALRRSVTVMLKRSGTVIPFDIAGLRLIDYDLSYKGVVAARERLKTFIQNGLESAESDSLVYEALPGIEVSLPARP